MLENNPRLQMGKAELLDHPHDGEKGGHERASNKFPQMACSLHPLEQRWVKSWLAAGNWWKTDRFPVRCQVPGILQEDIGRAGPGSVTQQGTS